MKEFTPQQLSDWEEYEYVRSTGTANMYSPQAREATGLPPERYAFVMDNYVELKKAARGE